MHEEIINCGSLSPDYGYYAPRPLADYLPNFTQYVNGVSIDPIVQNLSDNPAVNDPVKVVAQPLLFAKMSCDRLIRTRLADLRLFLGWNYQFCQNRGHFGLDIQAAAPTGNRLEAHYLFEPIVGNGHHWELGGGFHGLIRFGFNQEADRFWSFYGEANLTHVFKSKQKRTFDLCGKPMSRYMLAERMQTDIQDNLVGVQNGTDIIPTSQFAQEFAPVANISTVRVPVSASIQADIVALFNFTWCGFTWDVGYNFWAISCEKIGCVDEVNQCGKLWALKGDATVYGFESNVFGSQDLTVNQPVPLSATQNDATIHTGLNFPATGAVTPAQQEAGRRNPHIDNPLPASAATELTAQPGTNPAIDRINTSIQPVLITVSDLSTQTGRTKGISSKLFTHLGYTWNGGNCWAPFIGLGAEAEWGHHSRPDWVNDHGSCIGCAISQWGIWVKGGASFN